MDRIKIKNLLLIDVEDLIKSLNFDLEIIFDDSIIFRYNPNETILLVITLNPLVGLDVIIGSKDYDIRRENFKGSFLEKIFSNMYRDVIEIYPLEKSLHSELLKKMLETKNNINNLMFRYPHYMESISILDFLDIQKNEELLKSIKEVKIKNTVASVKNTYNVLERVMKKEEYKDNVLVKSNKIGTYKFSQLVQILGSRGFTSDINKKIFPTAIANGFLLGMNTAYDMGVESRSAAIAVNSSGVAIETSEYMTREIQLITMKVMSIVGDDCGTHEYLNYLVSEKNFNSVIGSYYFVDNWESKVIKKENRYLIGTIIKLRLPHHCNNKDPYTFCKKCFGDLQFQIPSHINLGFYSATMTTEKVNQSILSTKHLLSGLVEVKEIEIGEIGDKFFIVDNSRLYLKDIFSNSSNRFYLALDRVECSGIKNITSNTDTSKLSPEKNYDVSNFTIIEETVDDIITHEMVIRESNRIGKLSSIMLHHISVNGFDIDSKGRYRVELTNNLVDKEIFFVPETIYDFLSLVRELKNTIKYDGKRSNSKTNDELLLLLYDIVSQKLSANLAYISVLVYVHSVKAGTYEPGRNSIDKEIVSLMELTSNSTVGLALAHERLPEKFFDPGMYMKRSNLMGHPLNTIFKGISSR